MLALRANSTISVGELVDGLWGESPPATATKMVQLYVSQLRRVLPGDDARIVTHGRGYELAVDGDAVDAARFQRIVEQADRTGTDGAEVREALSLWRGGALADVADEPFAASEIRRLDELRLRAAELAVGADVQAGRDEQALADLERLIASEPLREHLYALRMQALYRSGRQAEALETYVAARRRLVDEVGIEPGPELRELHERILRHDPSLPRPAPRGAASAGGASSVGDTVPGSHGSVARGRRPRRRDLVIAAAAILLVAATALLVGRLTGPDHLDAIAEGAVGVIDPQAKAITAQYRVTNEPRAVAGGAGSVWVASPASGTVARIRPGEDRVDTIDVGGRPVALAFGGGSLWVADEESGQLAQVDPAANRVVQRIRMGNGLRALVAGDGAIWAASALDGEIVRLDTGTGKVTQRVAVGGPPAGLAAGFGAIWVAVEATGRLMRVDPRTGDVLAAIDVGGAPGAVAAGAGGVWTANRLDGTVSRVDPATERVARTVPAGREPSGLVITDRALWVADAAGAVRRLDPDSGRVTDTVDTGSSPAGLAAVGRQIWATTAPPASSHRGGTLRVGAAPFELDPAAFQTDYAVSELLYDGLVRYRRAPGVEGTRLAPGLAVAVPAAADGGRRYVFRLRSAVRYGDGSPLRAGDVRASLQRMLTSPRAAGFAALDSILGAAQCRSDPPRCDLSAGVLIDERRRTVTLKLGRADPELLANLALPPAVVLPARAPQAPAEGPIPGTGPYRVARIEPGQRVELARNQHFRAPGDRTRPDGFADRILVTMAGDERKSIAAVERGRLDIAGAFLQRADDIAALRTRFGARLVSAALPSTLYAWLNVTEPPFDDPRVRRALNLAIDRRAAVDALGGAQAGAPTCQLLPPGFAGYRPACPFTVDPSPAGAWTAPDRSRARRLAAGSDATRVVVWAPRPLLALGRVVARAVRDLGFASRLRVFDDLEPLLTAARAGDARPQVGLGGWIADVPEPGAFLRPLVTCAARAPEKGLNVSRFCDRGLDTAIDRAQLAGAEAGSAWERVERRIAAAAPIVPLVSARYPVVTSARVGNLQFHPVSGPLLDQVWVR